MARWQVGTGYRYTPNQKSGYGKYIHIKGVWTNPPLAIPPSACGRLSSRKKVFIEEKRGYKDAHGSHYMTASRSYSLISSRCFLIAVRSNMYSLTEDVFFTETP
jgi:hypothetical protein